jgi:hypothetical protein
MPSEIFQSSRHAAVEILDSDPEAGICNPIKVVSEDENEVLDR